MMVNVRNGESSRRIPVREVDGESGRLVLIEEEGRKGGLRRYNQEVASARRGLVISTSHPSKVTRRIEGGEVRWISRSKGGSDPLRIDTDMYREISRFIEEGGEAILMNGVEYLVWMNGFKAVARFLKRLGDKVSSRDAVLLVSINPLALEKKDIKLLEKAFDYVEKRGVGARVVERLDPGDAKPGWSYLVIDDKDYRNLKRFSEDALCVTTTQPAKVRRWDDFRGDILWISESEEEGALHTAKLGYEGKQKVLRAIEEGKKDIFIDDLGQLIVHTSTDEIIGLLKTISDVCARTGTRLFVSLDGGAVKDNYFALLRSMFDRVIG